MQELIKLNFIYISFFCSESREIDKLIKHSDTSKKVMSSFFNFFSQSDATYF
jgi:hypothetical protein